MTFTTPTSGTYTVGHGLSAAPAFVIFKARSSSGNWVVYHQAIGTNYLILNSTAAAASAAITWNAVPTATFVNFGSGFAAYGGATAVAYAWTPIAGYSDFGSYVGNGSTDGPFVNCGFRPRYIMVKNSSAVNQWNVWDSARNPYNTLGNVLIASSASAEDTVYLIDLLSNGFKPRVGAGYAMNDSGNTYVYAAFAESPFKYALAR
jgi:hypothetical protein